MILLLDRANPLRHAHDTHMIRFTTTLLSMNGGKGSNCYTGFRQLGDR
jgi:hypothetical protein